MKTKTKHFHYFELNKSKAYLLYDGESLIELDSPLSIGEEREVKNAVVKLPKDATISYYELKKVGLTKAEAEFKFKKTFTKYPKVKDEEETK